MKSKMIGGTLMVVGTTVGGAMLALPPATGPAGFLPGVLILLLSWALMTFCAFLILEVTLWFPQNSNIISMARNTLGNVGEIIAWITYLLLLYSLVAAYIASGTHIFSNFLNTIFPGVALGFSSLLFLLIFGSIVYFGMYAVDITMRIFILLKLASYLLIILISFSFINPTYLNHLNPKMLLPTVTIVITSFGFSTIVPSLCSYFKNDIHKLRLIIMIGSLISLGVYLFWIAAMLGTLPVLGEHGLLATLHSNDSATSLIAALKFHLNKEIITTAANIFISISVVTSFLGVSLSLSDFLADGIGLTKKGNHAFIVYALTFVPPTLIAVFYPGAFIACLNYAGLLCIILLVFIPAFMVWSGRYQKNISGEYRVWGGKAAILISMLMGIVVLLLDAIYGNVR